MTKAFIVNSIRYTTSVRCQILIKIEIIQSIDDGEETGDRLSSTLSQGCSCCCFRIFEILIVVTGVFVMPTQMKTKTGILLFTGKARIVDYPV